MRIVHDAHRDTSSFALDTRTETSGCLAEDGSPRSRPNESRHKFAAAISWLAALLIESFAAYGEAMYPCFVDPDEPSTVRSLSGIRKRRRPAESEHRSKVQLLSAGASRCLYCAAPENSESAHQRVYAPILSDR